MTDQFPIFQQPTPLGKRLVYLDSAASTQKPQSVIDAITNFYSHSYASTGRGSYWPANESTIKYEGVRNQLKRFINAQSEKEIIFTSGTTDSINKVANSFLRPQLKNGDRVIVTQMEHHSNYLPWQQVCVERGAELVVTPLTQSGTLDLDSLKTELTKGAQILAVTAVSNVLGTQNHIKSIVEMAHEYDVPVLVDAAQSVAHAPIDVQDWNCDFLAFSAHKCYGPTGVGVLYGKQKWIEQMQPANYGGGMVQQVGERSSSYRLLPYKHEAGTPNVAGGIGLGATLDFIQNVGFENIGNHEKELTTYALNRLAELDFVSVYGATANRAAVIAFNVTDVHPHDLSTFLNERGICIRAGHHCAQPLMQWLNVPATARASFGIYNTKTDVDELMNGLKAAYEFFV